MEKAKTTAHQRLIFKIKNKALKIYCFVKKFEIYLIIHSLKGSWLTCWLKNFKSMLGYWKLYHAYAQHNYNFFRTLSILWSNLLHFRNFKLLLSTLSIFWSNLLQFKNFKLLLIHRLFFLNSFRKLFLKIQNKKLQKF